MVIEYWNGSDEMNKKGLTLIEIIISIAILSIVVVMFLSIFSNQHRLIKKSSEDTSDLITNQRLIERELSRKVVGDDHQIDFSFGTINFEVDGVLSVEESFTNFIPGVDDTVIPVTNVTLPTGPINITELGASEYVPASVVPDNASNQNVTWSSSPEGIVLADYGVIRGFSVGTTTVTVTTEDGGFTAEIIVHVTNEIVGSDAELASIEYYSQSSWQSIILTGSENYSVTVPDNQPPEVRATISNPGPDDSISITQAKNYTQNVATIRVTIDGTTTEYTVTFTKG